MTERPILFSAPMVRALLDGSKTQTRRIAKPSRKPSLLDGTWTDDYVLNPGNHDWLMDDNPYGQPGDRLWVRETFMAFDADRFHYRADHADDPQGDREHGVRWTPSIHMPRAASRILLEVVSVRVERLQDISEADAIAEGARYHDGRGVGHSGWRHDDGAVHANARSAYARLWNDINGAGSWDANVWVWVIEFKRVAP